jgi:hypothetical protein
MTAKPKSTKSKGTVKAKPNHQGVHTGERVAPAKRAMILAYGDPKLNISKNQIAKLTSASTHTVAAILASQDRPDPALVAVLKDRMSEKLVITVSKSLELINMCQDLALLTGDWSYINPTRIIPLTATVDRFLPQIRLMDGEPTEVVDIREIKVMRQEISVRIEQLQAKMSNEDKKQLGMVKAKNAQDEEVIEVKPQ